MDSQHLSPSDADIAVARRKAAEGMESPSALEAVVATPARTLLLWFRNGTRLEIPLAAIVELATARQDDLREIAISPYRDSFSVPSIDVDIYVPGLVSSVLNSFNVRDFARLGGSKTSPKKRIAARANGKKGGRPKNAGTLGP
ncbi:MAG: DUF2442 domain-containing protein [Candidatus Eremiobacteraeota bacterium]|uniref:DUF2442 domain-containing protein n=1 Tax=mine drainage metagenome TaxID=410659 RepID=E6PI99_9ZZZZ|nr:DUF2442 domain-containing protein [Candidatus Eremiobacteraeota bacterium]